MLNTSDDFEASVDTSGKLERERLDRLSNIKIVSGSELMQTKFEAPRYFWEGILPVAGLCVMAASKASGKTMFLLQAADAISKGRDFLGIPTRLTKTLFVELELTKRKMQERLFKMGIVLDDNLGFAFNGKQGDVWLQTIQDAVVEYGYKLVVVDVLQRLWPEKADTNSYQDTYALLGPLRAIANELQCLIVLVTHCRKADVVDYIDGVIGSVGIVANADVILTLKRERGASEAALFIDGNDIEHKELALNFNTDPLGFSLKIGRAHV
jgi:RecA-family ATPase